MRGARIASLSAFLSVGAISLPLLASSASAVAVRPRTTPSVGTQLAELKGSDTGGADQFGFSVGISGTTVVVGASGYYNGAPGRAYVFTKAATGWKQGTELTGSDTGGTDQFGFSVGISGTTAVVGAPAHARHAGRAYVFTRTRAGWKQTAELKGSDTVGWDQFGYSVAILGTTVVVGAPGQLGGPNRGGRAYVFMKTGLGWKQAAELKGNDTVGSNFPFPGDWFGYSVAISGTTVVVGAPQHAYGGSAYVFTRTATGWRQVAELAGVAGDGFGNSVAVSSATVVVGAENHANFAGGAYVFTRTGAGWQQAAELKGSDTGGSDDFGISVAVSGTTALVGADEHANSAGRAYLFTETSTGWKQTAELKGSDTVGWHGSFFTGDKFGWSVAISGTNAVVGAAYHDEYAGRVYVFEA
jgi:hypothetical protein